MWLTLSPVVRESLIEEVTFEQGLGSCMANKGNVPEQGRSCARALRWETTSLFICVEHPVL